MSLLGRADVRILGDWLSFERDLLVRGEKNIKVGEGSLAKI